MSTRDELRRETHAKVLAIADRLFQERGFAATTIRDIATAADVSVGTVMAVGDKNRLLVSVFDRLIERVHEDRSTPNAQALPAGSATCADEVMALLNPFVGLFASRPELARRYASILVAGDHESAVFTELAASLIAELRAAISQSGGVSEADAAPLANAIHLAYLGTLFTWSAGASDDAAALGRSLHDTIAAICPGKEPPA